MWEEKEHVTPIDAHETGGLSPAKAWQGTDSRCFMGILLLNYIACSQSHFSSHMNRPQQFLALTIALVHNTHVCTVVHGIFCSLINAKKVELMYVTILNSR